MIKLNVSAANIAVEEKETLTEGRVGLLCQFRFTDEWAGLAKTAVFDGADSRDVILKSDTVAIPEECLAAEGYSLSVGVYGKNSAGDIVIPTVYATVGKIQRSAYPSGRKPEAPTPDVVAQIQQAAANAEALARSVREDADLGRFQGAAGPKGDTGATGATGPKGNTGEAATLVSKAVTYQSSDSGTIIPSGSWTSSIPAVPQGRYLWTKTELQFNSGEPIVSYSVARMGIDGSGAVSSVAGVTPDATGNVPLTAKDVGALADSDGAVTADKLATGAVINDKIATGAVTNEKTNFSAGFAPAGPIILKNGVHYGDTTPATGVEGQIFFTPVDA